MNIKNRLRLDPLSRAAGSLRLPGSKSISNRALLLAALANGNTQLHGVLDSDDTRVMIESLQRLGVPVRQLGDDSVAIEGGLPFANTEADLFLANAGTAIRPLTAALAFIGGEYTLSGIPRMHERPIGDLVVALQQAGADVDYLGEAGYPPLRIGKGAISTQQPIRVKGSVSSQFLTALLMAGPIVTKQQQSDLLIVVEGELISQPYIQITLNLMQAFGVTVSHESWQRFTIPAGAFYQSPGNYYIEGDASSASYFLALGAIGGGPIKISGVGSSSAQGDLAFTETLQAMGAQLKINVDSIEVTGPKVAQGDRLKAFDTDFNLLPDAAMTAAVLAIYADGPCTLRNIASWRVKETDRIHAMHTELQRLGAKVESGPDWLRVYPIAHDAWKTAEIETYDDHRMAMCFSLAAFGPVPLTILDPGCVSKTFPDYFTAFKRLVQP
ncbi:MAG TPA: 3-phosphoshikimate 1-carboxyvinyltransferase [Burkholderiaceae bacterium]|nr:3-phosphoshikimate 1-carboxyvinyltransferase [Burkholderiaceae bacterium]